MNSKQLFFTLGFGALAVALLALPGSSARKPAPADSPSENCLLAQAADDPANRPAPFPDRDGNEDVHVFVSSEGGWLGVGITEVTPDKVKELKLPAERGVLLGKIVPESPAAKAGLKESDVITGINGQRVEGTEQFRRMVREIPAGRTAQFTFWRDGHAQTIDVTLGKSERRHTSVFVAPETPGSFAFAMPDLPQMGDLLENGSWPTMRPRLGIDAENLEGEFGNFFGAPEGEGILVRGVFPDSPAAKAGLKVGDVITSVDGERIRSIGELRAQLAGKKEAKSVLLSLVRNKAPLSLRIDLPAPAEKRQHTGPQHTNI